MSVSVLESPRKIGRPKGTPKTGGRQAGTPNKLNADVKAAILKAFDQVGGADYLAGQAVQNPQAFMTLLGKVLPMSIAGAEGTSGKLVVRWES